MKLAIGGQPYLVKFIYIILHHISSLPRIEQ